MSNPCRINFYVVPAGPPYYASGISVAVGQCETHGMQMPGIPCTAETMCPIGRIERAVDDGLAKIAAAQEKP